MAVRVTFLNIFVLLTISISFNNVQSLNILGVFPLPAKSHFFVFSPYLKELANRGHNVTVISYYPQKEVQANYHDINLGESSKPIEITHPLSKSLLFVFISQTLLQAFSGPVTCRVLLDNEDVQNLWETRVKFDLVVVEQFNTDCGLALAHALKAPVMGITSHVLLPWHYQRFGVPYNPSYVTYDYLKGGTKPTLVERIQRSFLYSYSNFIFTHVSQTIEQNIVSEYISDVPKLNDLAKDIKLVLVYQNFILSGTSISGPNVIDVGGYHVAEPKPLPEDLKKFIDESEHGVIYISFGTLLKGSAMTIDKIQSIIGAISELPQRVVWKWNKRKLPINSTDIYLSKWLPQNDLLAHPKVVAFFSHCGLLGTTEAIYHGVPVVGMPIYGDQPTNAAAIEESGLGVQVEYNYLSKDYLLEKFHTVLNPAFRENVKHLSKAWHDRPIKAMDEAVFWTEFAARYKNVTFRPPVTDTPAYQYLCIDVYVVLFIFILINIVFLKFFISLLYRITVSKLFKKPQSNKNEKSN